MTQGNGRSAEFRWKFSVGGKSARHVMMVSMLDDEVEDD